MNKQYNRLFTSLTLFFSLSLPFAFAHADEYADTVKVFQQAGESHLYFKHNYGYALFPTIGKGGFVVGGAYGEGRVYKHNIYVGDTTTTQLSLGFQIGGQAYSEIIFFEDKRAFDEFTSGNFEFSAQASAVAITAGAQASAGTLGATASGSGGKNNAETAGAYYRGMAIFTIAKGGLMFEAAISGQKFTYKPTSKSE